MSRTVTHPYGECVNITNRVSLAIAAEPAPTTIRVPIVLALHANLVRLTVLVHTRTPLVRPPKQRKGPRPTLGCQTTASASQTSWRVRGSTPKIAAGRSRVSSWTSTSQPSERLAQGI